MSPRHVDYRSGAALDVGVDQTDLKDPIERINCDPSVWDRTIAIGVVNYQGLPHGAVGAPLIGGRDHPAFRIDVKGSLRNRDLESRLRGRLDDVEVAHLPVFRTNRVTVIGGAGLLG